MPERPKQLHLEVNVAGSWRRVLSFDPALGPMRVAARAHALFLCADSPRFEARIIAAGELRPALRWSAGQGWVRTAPRGAER